MNMKNRTEFTVFGKPHAQKRPRAFRRGKFIGVYSPKENVEYATKVVNAYLNAIGGLKISVEDKSAKTDCKYVETPLVIEIQAYFPFPKLTKKEQALNLPKNKFPTRRLYGDGDNIAKAILDGLNAIAYTDDSYVVELLVSKFFTTEKERVNVVIYEKE
jgi:Holliday junction resolvase RusA-like endonuclease